MLTSSTRAMPPLHALTTTAAFLLLMLHVSLEHHGDDDGGDHQQQLTALAPTSGTRQISIVLVSAAEVFSGILVQNDVDRILKSASSSSGLLLTDEAMLTDAALKIMTLPTNHESVPAVSSTSGRAMQQSVLLPTSADVENEMTHDESGSLSFAEGSSLKPEVEPNVLEGTAASRNLQTSSGTVSTFRLSNFNSAVASSLIIFPPPADGSDQDTNPARLSTSDNTLLLLNSAEDVASSAFYKTPIPIKNSAGACLAFTTKFSFRNAYLDNKGEGFTFAVMPTNDLLGSSGGGLGYAKPPVAPNFAVEFDFNKDDDSAVPDADPDHVAVDMKNTVPSSAPSPVPITGFNLAANGVEQWVWIDVDPVASKLSVSYSTADSRPTTPNVIFNNFKLCKAVLAANVFVGFTAATGITTKNTLRITSWSVNDSLPPTSNTSTGASAQVEAPADDSVTQNMTDSSTGSFLQRGSQPTTYPSRSDMYYLTNALLDMIGLDYPTFAAFYKNGLAEYCPSFKIGGFARVACNTNKRIVSVSVYGSHAISTPTGKPISTSLSKLNALTFLAISNIGINGPIPTTLLPSLPNLVHLSLSQNTLSGTFPDNLSGLTKLTNLNLSFNKFTGPLPIVKASLRADNNFFSGSVLPFQQATGRCPKTLYGNCLTQLPVPSDSCLLLFEALQQRDPTECDTDLTNDNSDGTAFDFVDFSRGTRLGAGIDVGFPDGSVADVLNNQLLLTPGTADSKGEMSAAYFMDPVPMAYLPKNGTCNAYSFSTSFSFTNTWNPDRGHGFAFVLVPSSDFLAVNYMGVGYYDSRKVKGFAVEFDFMRNMLRNTNGAWQDPNANHIGINVGNSEASLLTSPIAAFILGASGAKQWAWIEYDGAMRTVSVSVSASGRKPPKPQLVYQSIDLCSPQLYSPQYYVGFVSSAYTAVNSLAINSWTFSSIPAAKGLTFSFADFDTATVGSNLFLPDKKTSFSLKQLALLASASTGGAFYYKPVPLLSLLTGPSSTNGTGKLCVPYSWSTTFSFSNLNPGKGEGFTFAIEPTRDTLGSPGGYLGWGSADGSDRLQGSMAVEFDFNLNPELRDPNGNHIGVNVKDTSISQVTATPKDLILGDGTRQYVWIQYHGAGRILTVYVSATESRPLLPTLTYGPFDLCFLSNGNPNAGAGFYVGFTAGNSEANPNQLNIVDWSFYSTAPVVGTPPTELDTMPFEFRSIRGGASSAGALDMPQLSSASFSMPQPTINIAAFDDTAKELRLTTGKTTSGYEISAATTMQPSQLNELNAQGTCSARAFSASFIFQNRPGSSGTLGEGFAFTLSTSPNQVGGQYGQLSPQAATAASTAGTNIAVEFDFRPHNRTDTILGPHVGINLRNSLNSTKSAAAPDIAKLCRVWVEYEPNPSRPKDSMLMVFLLPGPNLKALTGAQKPGSPLLFLRINLCVYASFSDSSAPVTPYGFFFPGFVAGRQATDDNVVAVSRFTWSLPGAKAVPALVQSNLLFPVTNAQDPANINMAQFLATTDAGSSAIQLISADTAKWTGSVYDKVGRSVNFNDASGTCKSQSFEASFVFKNDLKSRFANWKGKPYADGFTFAITSNPFFTNVRMPGCMGYAGRMRAPFRSIPSIAVEFDYNTQQSSVKERSNPAVWHVGINLFNSPVSVVSVASRDIGLPFCRVWVSYTASRKQLQVFLSCGQSFATVGAAEKPVTALLTYGLDWCLLGTMNSAAKSADTTALYYAGFTGGRMTLQDKNEIFIYRFSWSIAGADDVVASSVNTIISTNDFNIPLTSTINMAGYEPGKGALVISRSMSSRTAGAGWLKSPQPLAMTGPGGVYCLARSFYASFIFSASSASEGDGFTFALTTQADFLGEGEGGLGFSTSAANRAPSLAVEFDFRSSGASDGATPHIGINAFNNRQSLVIVPNSDMLTSPCRVWVEYDGAMEVLFVYFLVGTSTAALEAAQKPAQAILSFVVDICQLASENGNGVAQNSLAPFYAGFTGGAPSTVSSSHSVGIYAFNFVVESQF